MARNRSYTKKYREKIIRNLQFCYKVPLMAFALKEGVVTQCFSRWMENIQVQTDPAGNIKPDKAKSVGKIDGPVAMIIVSDCWIRNAL